MGQPLAIVASGMVTGVGLSAAASCAAIRCGINNFQETRFMDAGGAWITGSEVPLDHSDRGTAKLSKILAMAIDECLGDFGNTSPAEIPIVLGLAEEDRPGRTDRFAEEALFRTQEELGFRFSENSRALSYGRASVIAGLISARRLIYEGNASRVIVAGVDSLLLGPTISSYDRQQRVLTSDNSDGFVPGEAAGAILVEAPSAGQPQLVCLGVGTGIEKAHVLSEAPLRADGLVAAIRASLVDAKAQWRDLDFRIADLSGEQYGFKEAALALMRLLRERKEEFDIWHLADCIGEVGAAIGPLSLAFVKSAVEAGFAPGSGVLYHGGNDDGKRVAIVLRYLEGSPN